jgi:hypothetical protein
MTRQLLCSLFLVFSFQFLTIAAEEKNEMSSITLSVEQATILFERLESLKEQEERLLVASLEHLYREGNLDAGFMLAHFNILRISVMYTCIFTVDSCRDTGTKKDFEDLVDFTYSILLDTTEHGKGYFELAILQSTKSCKCYSQNKYLKNMHLAAEDNNYRALSFLSRAYKYGADGITPNEKNYLYWSEKFELADKLLNGTSILDEKAKKN